MLKAATKSIQRVGGHFVEWKSIDEWNQDTPRLPLSTTDSIQGQMNTSFISYKPIYIAVRTHKSFIEGT
jgi:hypothetical protein